MGSFVPIKAISDGMFRFDFQRRYLLVLRAFFDDSGTHAGSKVVLWAGFMATEEEWGGFEQDWAALLKREGLKSFHMHDVYNALGQCEGWSRARSDSVTHDFRQVIANRDIIGIASSVRTDAWAEVVGNNEWLTARLVSPVALAFEHTIQQALHWAQRRAEAGAAPEKVAMFFDLREKDVPRNLAIAGLYADDLPWSQWFNGAAFVRMKNTLPLQAADMLAWESYRLELGRVRGAGETVLGPHLKAMIQDIPLHGQYYDAEALRTLASQIGRHERPDLMRPQGSDPSKGWFTMVENERFLRHIDLLRDQGVDFMERLLAGFEVEAHGEIRPYVEEYLARLRRLQSPELPPAEED